MQNLCCYKIELKKQSTNVTQFYDRNLKPNKMKTETVKIKLVNKEEGTIANQFVFVEIPIVSSDTLYNQVYMVKDFGCVFLS